MQKPEDAPLPSAGGCLRMLGFIVGLMVCFFVSMRAMSHLTERWFLSAEYGADRYAAGLRIVRKHYLTDGTPLPKWIGFWQGCSAFGLAMLALLAYAAIAMGLGLYRESDWEQRQEPRRPRKP